jgi:hypothetical protein
MKARHALISACAALLFALQALLSPLIASASVARHAGDGQSVTMTAFGEICHAAAGDPAKRTQHNHGDCCVLCESGLRDAALFVVGALAAAYAPPPQAATAPRYDILDADRPRLSGWASSWSSQAPPSFS